MAAITNQTVTPTSGTAESGRLVRLIVLFAAAFGLLTGCGVTYNSPKVDATTSDLPVKVVALSPATVQDANRSAFEPRRLPESFSALARGGGLRSAGAVPNPPLIPVPGRKDFALDPPENIDPGPYRIGIGDVVLLATKGTASTIEQLSGLLAAQNQRQGYTVRDDGAIAIPELGPVQIADMTIQEAEDALFRALVEKQIDPSFSLEVAEFNAQKVTVGGAVNAGKVIPVTLTPLRLREALAAAGGISAPLDENGVIRIYRQGRLYHIPLNDYAAKPDLADLRLINGDAIHVDVSYDLDRAMQFYRQQLDVVTLRSESRGKALDALETEIQLQRDALKERRALFSERLLLEAEKRDFVYLAGEVASQSRLPLPFEQRASLADMLYEAGGFKTASGDPSQIYVLRSTQHNGFDGVTAYHLNTKNAVNLVFATQLEMRPNDIIFIEEQPITKWGRALQQMFPALITSAGTAVAN